MKSNFGLFDSGNVHIRGSKKPGFTFPMELRTKFVSSHGLKKFLIIVGEKNFLSKKKFIYLREKVNAPYFRCVLNRALMNL